MTKKIIKKIKKLAATPTLLLVALFVATPTFAADPIQVWFGPQPQGSPDGLDTRFMAYVNGATKTLDCCFYELRLDSITDALVAAQARGVKVRFLVDDANYYGKDELGKINKRTRNPFIKKLITAKVEVKQDNNRRALMHNKFAIADGARVWTGSYNLTDTCSFNNTNNALQLEGEPIAKAYSRQFEEMFIGGEFGRTRTSTLDLQKVPVGAQTVEVLFAPEDDPQKRQIELLRGARKSIYFMQFAFTSEDVSDILVQKVKSGLTVKGIFDHRLYRSTGPYGEFAKLTASGIPAIVWSSPKGKFHHKAFIIDPGEPTACVLTGSENTSNNGNNQNDENVVVLHDPAIVAKYFAEFQRLFGSTARTSADLIYNESPVAGGTIDEVDLYIYANGQPVDTVQVEFPARWAVSTETIESMTVSVADQPLPRTNIQIKKTKILIKNAHLEATGPRGLLRIQLREVTVPEIPGGYSPLVSVSGPDGKMIPLASQPVIEVYDPKSPDFMVHMCETLRKQLRSINDLRNAPATDVERFKKAWQADFDRMRRTVVTAAGKGQWKTVAAVVAMLESLDKTELRFVIDLTGGARELRRALTAQAGESAEAKELLTRVQKILGHD